MPGNDMANESNFIPINERAQESFILSQESDRTIREGDYNSEDFNIDQDQPQQHFQQRIPNIEYSDKDSDEVDCDIDTTEEEYPDDEVVDQSESDDIQQRESYDSKLMVGRYIMPQKR